MVQTYIAIPRQFHLHSRWADVKYSPFHGSRVIFVDARIGCGDREKVIHKSITIFHFPFTMMQIERNTFCLSKDIPYVT